MKRKIRMGVSLGCSLLLSAASFGQITASNAETLVNSTTSEAQQNPAISSDTAGRYVVVWESEFQDGDGFGIYAKVYNADHSVRVADFLVNTISQTNDQRFPDVAMNADGDFCIVWQTFEDPSVGWDVYRKLYNIDGTALSSRGRVNSTSAGNQMRPAVAANDDYFVIGYMNESVGSVESHVEGRFYLANGAALSSAFDLDLSAGNHLAHLDIGIDHNANALFTWQSDGQDGDRKGVFVAGYQQPTTLNFAATQVNTTTVENQQAPSVAVDSAGNAMIVWSSFDQDGDHYGIYSRLLNTSGTFSGSEVAVNSTTANSQDHAKVTTSRSGNRFVVTWTDEAADGDEQGVYARYWEGGSFANSDELINTTTSGKQLLSDATYGSKNYDVMFAWQGGIRKGVSAGSDTDDYGVYTSSAMLADVTPPVAVCQNITAYLNGSGTVTISPSDIDGGSTDNVGITSYSASNTSFDCSDIGLNTSTLTVMDAVGLSDACSAIITVIDSTAPNAVCQNITVYLDGSGSASIVTGDIDAGSSDNCSIASMAISQSAFTCANLGANSVTLTVTDPSSNIGSCTATVTVIDSIPPTAICQDLTVYLDGSGTTSIVPSDVNASSNDNCSVASMSISPSSFNCADIGSNTVTLTVTDAGGNSATCTSTVTIVDSIAPVALCQDLTIYLDGSGNASITATDVNASSFDNCSLAGISVTPSSFTCANVGANTVSFTATDISGNTSSCSSTVTVIDSTAPTASCQNLTIYLDGSGTASIAAGDVDNGSSDNCGIVGYTLSQSTFTCTDVGANTVILTVADAGGNSATCVSTVTVSDSISPTPNCQDLTIYLDGSGNASITATDLNNGSSDNCGIASFAASPSSFTCANVGSNTVTLTVTDASGNSATCTSNVTVVDSISPTAICQNITVYLDGSGNASIAATDIDGGSSDNCGTPTLGIDVSSFTCANVGINNVSLTATDFSGNSSSCTATVTVIDSTAPTASCQNLTIYLDGSGTASIAAGDVDNGSSDNCGIVGYTLSQSTFTCTDVGANTVILTVADAGGNSATCVSTVTVSDSISPTPNCQDLTIYLDGSGNASVTAIDVDNGSSDNCGLAGISVTPSSFTCADVGTNTVTLTVTDFNGNSATCTSTITVIDSIPPTAVCQNITVYLDGSGNASIAATDIDGGSSDNCGTPTLGIDVSSFTCANLGTNNVSLTATDFSGNSSSCTATVTVIDSTAPTASCQDLTIYLDGSGTASITAGDVDNGSSDNCGIASYGLSDTSFDCADVGANTITLTVTDASGNSATCTSTVTVLDSIAPTASCQDVTVYLDGSGNASVTAIDVDNGSSDNCGLAGISVTPSSFTCADVGTNTVTLTVTDFNGNSATCTSTITVIDSIPPTAVCQNITVYLDGSGNASIAAGDVDGGSSDNCSLAGLSVTPAAFTCTQIGANTVTLTATDIDGNSSTCTATVTVIDSLAPTASCQDLTIYLDGAGAASITAGDVDNGSSDNCGIAFYDLNETDFDCADLGTNTVTLTVTDAGGNSATCTSVITVVDSIIPTASNLDTAFVSCLGDVPIDITSVDDEADNCGLPTVTHVGDVANNGLSCSDTIIRTYNVADASGNNIDVTQVIIVNDTTPPTASNPSTLTVVCLSDVPSTAGAAVWVTDEADNCGTPTVAWESDVSSNGTGCNDTITRSFSVSDECGNSIVVQQLIIVNDDVSPVPDATSLADVVGYCDLTPITPTATDNCAGLLAGVSDVIFPINTDGTTVVTWTFTDDCGNVTTQSQNVIVETIEVGTTMANDGITIISSNNDAGVTFQWIDCETDTELPGETNQNFTPTYSSNYAVIVTQDGCVDTSDCVTITDVGLTSLTNESLIIYPNPSTGQFTIEYNGGLKTVEMFDVLGRIVLTETDIKEGAIDASSLAPGKYMVRVETETNQVLVQPIVIGQK